MKYLILLLVATFTVTATADTTSVWKDKRVLVVGDSLIGVGSGLGIYLEEAFYSANAELIIKSKTGARPSTFSRNKKMAKLITEHRPDVVIIVLGMNTLRSPAAVVRESVKRLLEQVDTEECFWIGPPPLIEGSGWLIKRYPAYVAPQCKYFNTAKKMTFPPKSVSGFHVKRGKGRRWGRQFTAWAGKEMQADLHEEEGGNE